MLHSTTLDCQELCSMLRQETEPKVDNEK